MKKKTKTQPIPTTSKRYHVGDEFLYIHSKESMTKVAIEKITQQGYLLSNGVTIGDSLQRVDQDSKKYDYRVLPWTQETEAVYESYYAYVHLNRQLKELLKDLTKMDPFNLREADQTRVIYINKKLSKALSK